MKFLSVCSGIEAASVAWNPLGWKAAAFSEIEPFPCAVLAHHYPTVPNWGDMTKFKEWPDVAIDLLCGGTPCQSFSNAGLRSGLDDPRGELMLTFGAIAARYRPRWLVWENVPGVLSSSGGRDFGAFLGMLGQLGYGFAYRVLDAQFVRVDGYGRAVPQRRNRVFVVGCLGDWRSAAAVLLERESLRGDLAPRREAGARVAATLTRGADSSGKGGYAGRRQEDDYNIVPTAFGGGNTAGSIDVATCLTRHGVRQDFDTETFITHAPEVAATMVARSSRGGGQINSPGHNADGELVAFAFDARQADVLMYGDKSGPLDTGIPSATAQIGSAVRRLMPLECERLQGFPDHYTAITYRGKPAADGPRYKALGNSWAVNCPRWIGRRINLVDTIRTEIKEAA